MIRHVAMFRWKTGTSPEAVAAARAAVATLPGLIPEVRGLHMGDDLGLIEGTYDFVLVAEFDDKDGYRVYASHPEHLAVSRDYVVPIMDQIARVQYRVG